MTPLLFSLAMLVTGAQPPPTPAERQPPPATAAIRGRVIAGDTGLPLRRAEVWLNKVESSGGTNSIGARRNNWGTTTDAEGRYEFTNLPAGGYSLNVSKAPYVTGPLDPQAVNARMIELKTGETLDRVDVTLLRGGVIAGRVVDEFGEPLSGLEVSARRVQTISGRRQLVPFGPQGLTNDIGEFRIFGLEPGQYAVVASWRRMGPGDSTSPDRTGYPSTYFPGTTNEAEAQRFTVAAGQTISDLAMALSPIKTARVEGTVVDVDGRPMGNTFLDVQQSSPNFNIMNRQQLVQPDGTFVFASLAPGDYVFRTQPTPARQSVALLKLTVGSDDIKDLRLVAMPLAIVTGRIVVDPSLPPPNATQFSLIATPDEHPMPGGRPPAVVADDLTFELTALPGRNHITSAMLPPGWTMRSVRVNNVEAIDDGFDAKPGEKITGVDIELTSKVAVVAGLVTNARGEAVKDCTLLIFPADSRRWNSGRYLRTARPEQDGRFKISGLVPADYYIIAVDKIEGGQWPQHDFLDRIRAKATSVTIGEGETKAIDLKVTTGS